MIAHQSNFPYWLTCEGRTEVRIIRGQVRFAANMDINVVDAIELQDDRLNYERWTVAIPTGTITSPVATGPTVFDQVAGFPALRPEALELWNANKPVVLFLNFDIWYRDAFPETPVHHLSMNFSWHRQSEGWRPNPFMPSTERDEANGETNHQT